LTPSASSTSRLGPSLSSLQVNGQHVGVSEAADEIDGHREVKGERWWQQGEWIRFAVAGLFTTSFSPHCSLFSFHPETSQLQSDT
jgi:hypothetical protein